MKVFSSIRAKWDGSRGLRLGLKASVVLLVLGLCFAGGWLSRTLYDASRAPKMVRGGGYFFINPLLECEQPEESFSAFAPFEDEDLSELASRLKEEDRSLHQIAIYYRDLSSGYWVGSNEAHKFSPASIRKVPLVLAWLKYSETYPDALKRQLTYDGSFDFSGAQVFIPGQRIVKGSAYTVEELVYRSLLYSDNNAAHLLYINLPGEYLVHAYTDLGLEPAAFKQEAETMDVQSVASFFRILYNASYLTNVNSELVLGILSQAEFRAGLVAGVPPGVRVAHKFGENMLGTGGERKQLHDCGIVYHPMRPYVICVMAEGETFQSLPTALSSISRNIYARVTHEAMRNGKGRFTTGQ